MKDASDDPRQKAILLAAWTAFAAYGYRKTSMDDIARRAGMSRPALYLHYRNKEDIFRSLVQHHYDQVGEAVQGALAEPGSIIGALDAAFAAQGGDVAEAMLSAPHGMELHDTGSAVASDIVARGEERLCAVYAAWLSRTAGEGRIRLAGPAQDLAGTMTAALKGIKMAGTDYATYKTRVSHLATLIGAGLEAGSAPGTCDESP